MPLRALRVSLDTKQSLPEELPASVEQQYLGGRGGATWMLANRLPPAVSALAPANLLIFSAGPLSGMDLPATGGFVASTRSPLTGLIAHSWAQGRWGGALRRAGYDMLVLQGQSADWCLLQIDGARVQLLQAGDLLGLDTVATARVLGERLGSEYSVLCIGPAGEAGVAYSSIVADGSFMAEPAGTGAIMANKRVKAIVVRGGAQLGCADSRRVAAVQAGITRRITTNELAAGIRQFGSLFY